jgi:ankyrin repeat protein
LLEKERENQGSQHMQHALGSLALHEDRAAGETDSVSRETVDANGMTALLRAASGLKWREVRKLILSGADPSGVDGQGLTVLHYTAFYGSAELARTLIEHGPAGLALREAPLTGTSVADNISR